MLAYSMYAIQNGKMSFGDNEYTSSVKVGTFLEQFNVSRVSGNAL